MSSISTAEKTPGVVPKKGNEGIQKKRKRKDFSLLTALLKTCVTPSEYSICCYLLDHGPSTRGEIVDGTGVKWTTAHDSLVRMQVRGIVKQDVMRQSRGRPKVFWSLAV